MPRNRSEQQDAQPRVPVRLPQIKRIQFVDNCNCKSAEKVGIDKMPFEDIGNLIVDEYYENENNGESGKVKAYKVLQSRDEIKKLNSPFRLSTLRLRSEYYGVESVSTKQAEKNKLGLKEERGKLHEIRLRPTIGVRQSHRLPIEAHKAKKDTKVPSKRSCPKSPKHKANDSTRKSRTKNIRESIPERTIKVPTSEELRDKFKSVHCPSEHNSSVIPADCQPLFDKIHNFLSDPQQFQTNFTPNLPKTSRKELERRLKEAQMLSQEPTIKSFKEVRESLHANQETTDIVNHNSVTCWRRVEVDDNSHRKHIIDKTSSFDDEIDHLNILEKRNSDSLEKFVQNRSMLIDIMGYRMGKVNKPQATD